MSEQFAVSRPVKRRSVVRAFNDETALKALQNSGFGKGRECFGFNKGQFSIIDVIMATLTYTGPAEVTIATWTAADADLRRCAETMKAGEFTSVRWLIDYSFEVRQPVFCNAMRNLFGDETIRTTHSHAKFVLMRSQDWSVVIQTSMNLNFNKRLENFWVADDPELFEAFSSLVEDIFAAQKAGESFGKNTKKVAAQTNKLGRQPRLDPFSGVPSIAQLTMKLPEF